MMWKTMESAPEKLRLDRNSLSAKLLLRRYLDL